MTAAREIPASHAQSLAVVNMRVRMASPSAIRSPVARGIMEVPAFTSIAVYEGQMFMVASFRFRHAFRDRRTAAKYLYRISATFEIAVQGNSPLD